MLVFSGNGNSLTKSISEDTTRNVQSVPVISLFTFGTSKCITPKVGAMKISWPVETLTLQGRKTKCERIGIVPELLWRWFIST